MNVSKAIPALFVATALCCAHGVRAEGPHWSYQGHGGPAEWGELDPEFATCKLGKLQSPIDIRGAKAADLPAIKFDYKPSPLKVDRQRPHDPGELRAGQLDRRSAASATSWCSSTSTSRARRRSTARRTPWSRIWCTRTPTASSPSSPCCSTAAAPTALIDTIWKQPAAGEGEGSRRADATHRCRDAAAGGSRLLHVPGLAHHAAVQRGRALVRAEDAGEDRRSEITAFGKIYPMNARPSQPLNGRTLEATR